MLQKICTEIFPIVAAYQAEKIIKKNISEYEEKKEIDFYDFRVPLAVLKEHHDKELERKKTIEDKAKANVVGVTIAITLVNPLVVFINAQLNPSLSKNVLDSYLGELFIATVLFGLSSLLLGGWAAFRALRIRGVYDLYLNDEIEIYSAINKEKIKNAKYRKCWELNQRYSNIAGNFVDVSYTSIRNGVIAIFIAMIEILLIVYWSVMPSWYSNLVYSLSYLGNEIVNLLSVACVIIGGFLQCCLRIFMAVALCACGLVGY